MEANSNSNCENENGIRLTEEMEAQLCQLGAPGLQNHDGRAKANDAFDPLIRDIAQVMVDTQTGSTSFVQRQFGVSYNRAGRICDQLERMGIVSRPDPKNVRQVLVASQDDLDRLLREFNL